MPSYQESGYQRRRRIEPVAKFSNHYSCLANFALYLYHGTDTGASSSTSQRGAHSQRGGRSTPSQPTQTPVPSTQHGYGTRRSSGSSRAPVPPLVSSPPPKRTRISRPGKSSRAPPSPPASTIPGSSHLAEVLKRPMIAGPPLPGNTDIRDRPFHDEICMEHETLRLLPELDESYRILQRYHIEPFMTPRSFYYPRVVLDFYQTMTIRGVQDPIAIHFLIDGQHGILEARDIAAPMHFPPIPEDLGSFRHWSQYSEPDMVSTLSGGRVTGRTILRRELPPQMLLIDLVLHTNLFHSSMSSRGEVLS
ncbi:hypothetical protein CK203_030214 [Vitis vinifera]|uniref:Uncharacterized protein n=1 Tax=Vitis vinifera TaxID=29760 RepID=A0A438I5A1_VITVI|nr:hypothetical protein CK203_030214 [Vitis vinifera]